MVFIASGPAKKLEMNSLTIVVQMNFPRNWLLSVGYGLTARSPHKILNDRALIPSWASGPPSASGRKWENFQPHIVVFPPRFRGVGPLSRVCLVLDTRLQVLFPALFLPLALLWVRTRAFFLPGLTRLVRIHRKRKSQGSVAQRGEEP